LIFDSISYSINDKHILRGIYLKLEKERIIGLFGLNGSGKSTLLKIAADYLSPTSGSIFIDNINYSYKNHDERYSFISYLPQNTFLPKDVKVKTVLNWFGNSKELIEDSHIVDQLNKKVFNLSGGELKYLELSLLLSLDKKYILLDEPFTGIEPKFIDTMIERIRERKIKGTGILITDHYYRYVSGFIDDGYYLHDGYCKKMNLEQGAINSLINEGYLNSK